MKDRFVVLENGDIVDTENEIKYDILEVLSELEWYINEYRNTYKTLKTSQNQKAIECLKEVREIFEKRLYGKQWEDKVYIGSICNMINDVLDNKIKELESNNDNKAN